MLTKKSKYALKALLYLAKNEEQLVQISELSTKENIPQKFLENILLELRNHGILYSKRGKDGGYKLGKTPEEITFGQIIRILDGPLAPIGCVSQIAYQKCDECIDEKTCNIRRVMKKVRDQTAEILDGTTLKDALNQDIIKII
ncbi:MAG: RrF2 family transcriptional regulator [Cytophagaceae bacterium]